MPVKQPKRRSKVEPALIKAFRKRMHLNQFQFAMKLGIRRETVWRWENGVSGPSPVQLKQIHQMWGFSFGKQVKEDR